MKNKIISGMAAAILTTLATTAWAGEDKEVKLTLDQVPAAVQAAVKAHAPGAEIKRIEGSDVDGTKVIEFDLVQNGKTSEAAFRPDGKLFSTEEEIALANLPAAVQKTIAKKSKRAKASPPEKIVQEGKISYEIVIEKHGEKTEYTISPAGKITGKEEVGQD